ncbi:MAG: Crp/Fnr family transcriptional regulator [Bacteroidota bacterium]
MNTGFKRNSCVACKNKSACFEKLSVLELEGVDTNRVEVRYKKGEIIAKQGSFVTHILFVKEGLTKMYMEVNDDHNLILNLFPKGSLIGLPSLYNGNIAQYSVSAIEDTVICTIDKKVFEDLILNNGEFATYVISTINNCTFHNFDKILSLTQKQHTGRLAEALLFISKYIYHNTTFKLSLSRKDIAEYTGMSIISVVRILKDFNKDGIINSAGKTIEIIDVRRLERISDAG